MLSGAVEKRLGVSLSVSRPRNSVEPSPAGDISKLAMEVLQVRFRLYLANQVGALGARWLRKGAVLRGLTVPNSSARAMLVAEPTKGCTVTFMTLSRQFSTRIILYSLDSS